MTMTASERRIAVERGKVHLGRELSNINPLASRDKLALQIQEVIDALEALKNKID